MPQGSVLRPLLFLIYVNDLPGITSICKIFADDTSFFYEVINAINSENTLNADLKSISNWAYQWKMQFNPDPKKQANEVIFSRISNKVTYPPVIFNNNSIAKYLYHKHLGVVLDSKLDFSIHSEHKIKRCNKLIGLLWRLLVCFSRKALFIIYKSFVRSHPDYGNILYDKPDNQKFESKTEKVHYEACIAITGAIQGTSRKSLYDELGLMSSKERRWYNKLTFFYKIVNGLLTDYLQSYIEASIQDN